MQTGGIILCGGKSSRMGRDKATLPFGPELMLNRVIRLLSEVVEQKNIVIVAAPGQQLPRLPAGVTVTHDRRPDHGPLEALSAGLTCLNDNVAAAYVTSCDAPLLVPAFAARMFDVLDQYDIAVPRDVEHFHPLAAVYRRSVLPAVEKLLLADRLRPQFLFDEVNTRFVEVDTLRDVDAQLQTLMNLNRPDDYQAALESVGFLGNVWKAN